MEVAHYFRMLPKAQYDDLMDALLSLSTLRVRDFDFGLARLSVELLGRYAKLGIGGRDAAIMATMMAEGVNKIATHDKAFRAVPELTVIDPIPDKQGRFKNLNGFTALLGDARGATFPLAFVTFPFLRLAPNAMQRTTGVPCFPRGERPELFPRSKRQPFQHARPLLAGFPPHFFCQSQRLPCPSSLPPL